MRVLSFLLVVALATASITPDFARDLRARVAVARAAHAKRVEEARSALPAKIEVLLVKAADQGETKLVVNADDAEVFGAADYGRYSFSGWWNARYPEIPCEHKIYGCSLTHCGAEFIWQLGTE